MNKIITNSLFKTDPLEFKKLKESVIEFNALYNGNNIIQDDIFNIMINYARRKEQHLELLRLPIKDDDFCAFTCVRKGKIFTIVNSYLPICKQIFAAGHELYHIFRYISDQDDSLPISGSFLTSIEIDEIAEKQEDMEANAFSALLLAPSDSIVEQIRIYDIDSKNIDMIDIVRLMDIFAIPFKAIVLRLFEEKIIDENTANKLLTQGTPEIVANAMKKRNVALRWQKRTVDEIDLGSLPELIIENQENDLLPSNRINEDKKTIDDIIKSLLTKRGTP